VDNNEAARLQDVCRADLEEDFMQFRDAHKREDADRIRLMVKSLQQHLEAKRRKAMDRIASYEASGNPKRMRMIPAELGRIKKEELRIEQRIAELRLRAETKAQDSVVSSGLIKVQ